VRSCSTELLPASILLRPLKLKLDLQLNHSESRTPAEDPGRGGVERLDLAECLVGTAIVWQAEVGVVEEIEELKPDPQHGIFPTADFRVFHDGEVGVEVAWPTKVVASLSKRNYRPVAART